MADRSPKSPILPRDGTSQSARPLAALDPSFVEVDERGLEKLLAFAREFAGEIRYYDLENRDRGDWSDFIGRGIDIAEVAAFVEDPGRFSPDESPHLFRPHFVLFLTFLKLLGRAQGELNGLTRRHLEFYYRRLLRLRAKPAIPDSVNLLLDLSARVEHARLPAGSRLSAGPDTLGVERIYATDRDIVVNRAQVARLSSVYVEKLVIGIREAHERHPRDGREACAEMFRIALGDPLPGDPLPPYPGSSEDEELFDLLTRLHALLKFARPWTGPGAASHLFMEFFELREMMQLKHLRDGADAEWDLINKLLEKAGKTRDAAFVPVFTNPRKFDDNFKAAMGGAPNFDTLPEVNNVYDLYGRLLREGDSEDLVESVRTKVFFQNVEDFKTMMRTKVRIDDDWKQINLILELAGQRKRDDPAYRLVPKDPAAFDKNFATALAPVSFSLLPGVEDIEGYYAAFLLLEEQLFMSAESFAYVMAVVEEMVSEEVEPSATELEKTRRVLAKAHREKVYARRRNDLRALREANGKGFPAMIRHALGKEPVGGADPALLDQLAPYLGAPTEIELLEQARGLTAAAAGRWDKWDDVYQVVEVAQRNREDLPEPVARSEKWLNLYPAADATTTGAGSEAGGDVARWRTFGAPHRPEPEIPPAPILGWALSSPLLAMGEGKRTISLTLGFRADGFETDKLSALMRDESPLLFEVTTEKGWIEAAPPEVRVGTGTYKDLTGIAGASREELVPIQFDLTFDEDADPIAPLPAEETEIDTSWPMLRLMLRQIRNEETRRYEIRYPQFSRLLLAAVHVRVAVTGLTSIRLQNDETTLDAKKPFEPFGASPTAGSRLLLGHPEVVSKKLDTLRFRVEWMGAPANPATHYANYDIGPNPAFTTRISMVDRRLKLDLLANAALLSNTSEATLLSNSAALEGKPFDVAAALLEDYESFRYDRISPDSFGDDLRTWDRYLSWELNSPDFQHQRYPAVAAAKAVAMATDIANKKANMVAAHYQVNPPYTPKIKSLQLDYSSSVEVLLRESVPTSRPDRLLHIHPFGHCDVEAAERPLGDPPFLPRYDNEGELYIGLRDLRAPQNVALLMQMAEGSADPDLEPEPVRWSYLSGDRWKSLDDGRVLHDSSRGLINTGIVELELPAVRPSTRLPRELYWIRAAVPRASYSVCDTVAIHTQAVAATFVDNGNAPEHFSRPLPAATITELAVARPDIGGVRQPYTSYGGRMAEAEGMFNTRVSERLRHKHRALSMWDYERLALDRFPELYKVKCLPADLVRNPDEPGKVEVIVIPDIRSKLPFNPFEPKAPTDLLASVREYLAGLASASARVEVRNALYVAVKARFAVRFAQSGNEGYYKQRLNDELNRFLSPWAYEEGADIVIGGRIYANSIVDFLDRRPYVDYIADLKLFSSVDGENFLLAEVPGEPGYCVSTDRADGVLVAARQHEIDLITDAGYKAELRSGINFMKLELDFKVAVN